MSLEPFRFSLEPELVAVEADRDEVQGRVQAAQEALGAAAGALARARENLAHSTQRLRAFQEEEVAAPGAAYEAVDWSARTEYLEALRSTEERARGTLAAAQDAERTARHTLRNLERRLTEVELSLRALKEERERQRAAWQRDKERYAEKNRDEEAQLRWAHEDRQRRRREDTP